MSERNTFTLTTLSMWLPAASRTAARFLMHWCYFLISACIVLHLVAQRTAWEGQKRTVRAATSPSTILPVSGFRATWPLQKTKPPATMAWLRTPSIGGGAAVVRTTCFVGADMMIFDTICLVRQRSKTKVKLTVPVVSFGQVRLSNVYCAKGLVDWIQIDPCYPPGSRAPFRHYYCGARLLTAGSSRITERRCGST